MIIITITTIIIIIIMIIMTIRVLGLRVLHLPPDEGDVLLHLTRDEA